MNEIDTKLRDAFSSPKASTYNNVESFAVLY